MLKKVIFKKNSKSFLLIYQDITIIKLIINKYFNKKDYNNYKKVKITDQEQNIKNDQNNSDHNLTKTHDI